MRSHLSCLVGNWETTMAGVREQTANEEEDESEQGAVGGEPRPGKFEFISQSRGFDYLALTGVESCFSFRWRLLVNVRSCSTFARRLLQIA